MNSRIVSAGRHPLLLVDPGTCKSQEITPSVQPECSCARNDSCDRMEATTDQPNRTYRVGVDEKKTRPEEKRDPPERDRYSRNHHGSHQEK